MATNGWLSIRNHLRDASATLNREHRTTKDRLQTLRFVRTDLRECLVKVDQEIERLERPARAQARTKGGL